MTVICNGKAFFIILEWKRLKFWRRKNLMTKFTGFLDATNSFLQMHLASRHSSFSLQSEVLAQLLFALFATLRQVLRIWWKCSTHLHVPFSHSENLSCWRHWSCNSQCLLSITAIDMQRPSWVAWKSFKHSHLSLTHSVLGRVHGHSFRLFVKSFGDDWGRRRKNYQHMAFKVEIVYLLVVCIWL